MSIRWLRYHGEMAIAGTNVRMRLLLESGKGPTLQSPLAYDLRRGMTLAMHKVRQLDRRQPAPSAPPSLPPGFAHVPRVLYQSPAIPEVFQCESGWPDSKPVERWIHGEEGMA